VASKIKGEGITPHSPPASLEGKRGLIINKEKVLTNPKGVV